MADFCTNCGAPRGSSAFCTSCGLRFADTVSGPGPGPSPGPGPGPVVDPPTEPMPATEASPELAALEWASPESPAESRAAELRAAEFRSAESRATEPWPASDEPEQGGRFRRRPKRPPPELGAPEPGRLATLVLSGWLQAVKSAGLVLAIVLVGSAVVGTAIAVVAVRDVGIVVDAVTLSVPLLFAALGVRVGASQAEVTAPIGFLLESPALPWLFLGVVASRQAVRSGSRSIERDRDRLVALVAKIALLASLVIGVLAVMLPRGARRLGVEVLVHGWEAVLVTFVLVSLSGLALLVERGLFPVPADQHPALRRGVRAVRSGVAAYGIILALMVPLVVLAGLQMKPSTDDIPALALAMPVVGGTLAVLASAVVTGSVIDMADGSLGLSSLSFPPVASPPAAPRWVILLLVAVPAVLAWRTWRALARERPRDRRASLAVGACVGAGFVAAGWTAMWLSRLVLYSATAGEDTARFTASLPLVRSWALLLLWAGAASLLPALLCRMPRAGSPPASGTDWRKADAFAEERS